MGHLVMFLFEKYLKIEIKIQMSWTHDKKNLLNTFLVSLS